MAGSYRPRVNYKYDIKTCYNPAELKSHGDPAEHRANGKIIFRAAISDPNIP
jgi:hypothetical protein